MPGKTKYIIVLLILILLIACKQNGDFAKRKSQEFEDLSKELELLEAGNKNSENESQNVLSKEKAKTYNIKVVNVYNHDPAAYTQGLFFHNGYLFESTGITGQSTLRKVEPETGKIIQQYDLKGGHFAEGIEIYEGNIYQLTWVSRTCFVYDAETLNLLTEYSYWGEGWGLTKKNDLLIMSNGSHILKFINPDNFKIVKTIEVRDDGKSVTYLNELEYINGEIWANVYLQKKIARINPETGAVNSWVDLSSLYEQLEYGDYPDVLNGIAYDKENNRIFVTGKLWKYVFEIKIDGEK